MFKECFRNLILGFQGFLFSLFAGQEIRFEEARGSEIAHYASDLVKLSDTFYRHYPYFYDATQSDETFYLNLYARWPEARLVVAFDREQPIGYAIGLTMKDIPVGQESLVANGYALDSIFLIGEFVTLESYRGQCVGKEIVVQMEYFAKKELGCQTICLMQIDEDLVLRSKPENYQSNDHFWHELGYTPYPNLRLGILWKNINESWESNHPMFYWIKEL